MHQVQANPRQLSSFRVTKHLAEGSNYKLLVFYQGGRGSEVWLKEDQSLAECLAQAGFYNREFVPTFIHENGWTETFTLAPDANLEQLKALYCSHPNTIEAAAHYFEEIQTLTKSIAGDRLSISLGKNMLRVSVGSVRTTGRLRSPQQELPRALEFTTDYLAAGVSILTPFTLPDPAAVNGRRMIWKIDDQEVSAKQVAEKVIAALS